MKGTFCWVTIMQNEEDFIDCIIFAESLRNSKTTGKLYLYVSLSDAEAWKSDRIRKMLKILSYFYDAVEKLSDAKFSSLWSKTLFSKCAFADPKTIIRKYPDSVFSWESILTYVPSEKEEIGKEGNLPDLFVFKPSQQIQKELYDWLSEGQSFMSFFKDKYPSKTVKILDSSIRNLIITSSKSTSSVASDSREAIFKARVLPKLQSIKLDWISSFITSVNPSLDYSRSTNFPKTNNWTSNQEHPTNPIAVIGMGCRFPGANSLEEYWNLLEKGQYVVRRFPPGREAFNVIGVEESVGGFLSCPINSTDFLVNLGIPEEEVLRIDPQQRLLLEVVFDCLKNAGKDPKSLKGTNTGVFMANLLQDYKTILSETFGRNKNYTKNLLATTLSGFSRRVSWILGTEGISLSHEAGCSSGLGALHLACQSLSRNESNEAICGGVNLILLPRAYNTAVLSSDYKCKTFDETADGFVSGEGIGVLLLKRLEDAVNDGDPIRAVIRGTAMSNDGASLCYGTPNPDGHATVYELAMKEAKVEPSQVTYIESHGTGTQKGDVGEVYGIRKAYGKNRQSPVLIGSAKPNIGHGEAAASIGSLIKIILAIEKGFIPPNILLNRINSKINLEEIPAIIPTELTPWPNSIDGNEDIRIGGISAFSLTGSLVHAIIQSYP